jgi:hypothetical protein
MRGATEYKVALKTLEAVFALRQSIDEARKRDRMRVLHDPKDRLSAGQTCELINQAGKGAAAASIMRCTTTANATLR